MENPGELTKKLLQFKMGVSRWLGKNANNIFSLNENKCYLSERQFLILVHLDTFTEMTVSQFEKIFCIGKSSLSITISKLEHDGYIGKKKGSPAEDGRKVYIFLTEKGKEFLAEANMRFEKFLDNFFAGLSENKRKDLILAIDIFNSILSEEEQK